MLIVAAAPMLRINGYRFGMADTASCVSGVGREKERCRDASKQQELVRNYSYKGLLLLYDMQYVCLYNIIVIITAVASS